MKKTNKILNNNYAPGIATYGIDGKTGDRGDTGTSIYFTTYNLEYNAENELAEVMVKINQNKILSSYTDRYLGRTYEIGDIIIDSSGFLYKIVTRNGAFDLQYISQIKIDDSADFFERIGNRVILTEQGLDIFDTYQLSQEGLDDDAHYPLRLISAEKSLENGRFELLSLICQSYNSKPKSLNVYYDQESNSFCFDSDSNIVFDVKSLMVKETDETVPFSDYYKVEPYNDPIGLVHREYSQSKYVVEGARFAVEGLNFNKYANLDIKPDFIKFVVFGENGIEYEAVRDFDKTQNEIQFEIGEELQSAFEQKKTVLVSLIKGIEISINSAVRE